jgi:glycosyltransferase involved in cell wall biosynthesis
MPTVLCIPEMLDEAQPNACGYIRVFLPLTKKVLREHFDVRFVKLADLPFYSADVVVTQRTAVNTQEKADRLLAYCRASGARLVFDLDDDLLSLSHDHPEHALYDSFRPLGLRLVAEADELWTSTKSLADRFVGIARRVAVMPNQIDERVWTVRADDASKEGRPVRFLYMGTSTHGPDFDQLIRPALRQLKLEYGEGLQFDLIGVGNSADPDGDWNVVRRPPAVGNSYPAFATWLQSLGPYDVGVAPLVDVVFNRCKSDLKFQEYSAMGLATVAADLAAYNETIAHEVTGLLVKPDAGSFEEAMRRVIRDADLRLSLQRSARHLAVEKLNAASRSEPRLERLRELAGRPRRRGYPPTSPRAAVASDLLQGRIDRKILSWAFLQGQGIEIGALQKPLPVPPGANVTYVDRMTKDDLYEQYPELRPHDLIEVDVIDNGETLATFGDATQDFIIVNHFIEHCQDPIGTLKNFLRVLRPGGIIYMAIPDKRHTFDRDRASTELNHIVNDHAQGPDVSRTQHFREWVTLVEPHFGRSFANEDAIESRVRELMAQDYSIHFHTFIPEDVSGLVAHCVENERMDLSVVFAGAFDDEMIFIMRRTSGAPEVEGHADSVSDCALVGVG